MSIPGRAEAAVKGLAVWVGIGMASLATGLAGLGFLVAGFFCWVDRLTGRPSVAGAITGVVLILLAVLNFVLGTLVLRRIKRRQPTMMQEIGGMAGMAGSIGRLAGLIVRRDPKKSLVLAVLAGAVAEYIVGGDKRRN